MRLDASPTSALRRDLLLIGLLALLAILAMSPALGAGFVNYDDDIYVTGNPWVSAGVTAAGVRWSFANLKGGYWIPLTWLSFILDAQIWGMRAIGFHLTNVLLHAGTTGLLFVFFRRATSQTWASFLVAGLFGVHPLHVESVAWVYERKDVLSGFFGALTLWLYSAYAHRSGWWRLLLVYAAFACSLMAKPMLLPLPLVMLLLDVWPLRRWARTRWFVLIIEKMPLLAFSAVALALTFKGEAEVGAVAGQSVFTPLVRLETALVSTAGYLWQTLWPLRLAIVYPHPGQFSAGAVVGSVAILGSITLLAWSLRRTHPWLIVGWMWYLLLIGPTSGVVQVGGFYMADRFSYFPSIGLFVMLTFSLPPPTLSPQKKQPLRRWPLVAGVTTIVLLAALSFRQCCYWHDSQTLWEHDIAVVGEHSQARVQLGSAAFERNDLPAALDNFAAAENLNPNRPDVHFDLGVVLAKLGAKGPAVQELTIALKLNPSYARARQELLRMASEAKQTSGTTSH